MRPRRMAAEIGLPRLGFDGVRGASMRPRRMAAEILLPITADKPRGVASMRPRRMAAEIVGDRWRAGSPDRGLQ